MEWDAFLKSLCRCQEYRLTPLEIAVVLCLKETPGQTKHDLLKAYISDYGSIEPDAFTQRLKNIYRKFEITEKGHKLPQLHRYLSKRYAQYRNKDIFFAEAGLNHIYPNFPRDAFGDAIHHLVDSHDAQPRVVDILQTFAPNLDDYVDHLGRCLNNSVKVRILLAWPYSEAAKLREEVLRKYANEKVSEDLNIRDCVIANLETLESIIQGAVQSEHLDIKLYDTLPSLAIYRAGDYMLAAPFLHGSLAISTFQLALTLNTANPVITRTLQQDFELMWQVARPFCPDPNRNWRNDLKILFSS